MLYNSQPTQSGHQMPLLMGFSTPQPIEIEESSSFIIYDPLTQISQVNMRIVGTYSLKSHTTRKITSSGSANVPDRKNEIDDQKSVK